MFWQENLDKEAKGPIEAGSQTNFEWFRYEEDIHWTSLIKPCLVNIKTVGTKSRHDEHRLNDNRKKERQDSEVFAKKVSRPPIA